MFISIILLIILCVLYIYSCNKNSTEHFGKKLRKKFKKTFRKSKSKSFWGGRKLSRRAKNQENITHIKQMLTDIKNDNCNISDKALEEVTSIIDNRKQFFEYIDPNNFCITKTYLHRKLTTTFNKLVDKQKSDKVAKENYIKLASAIYYIHLNHVNIQKILAKYA